ncbi:MAG TPA: DUF2934 domain-containing protein [Blastocatellia bacterium]|nr:DUF2934 domain-containing protein [Blastocatellia bacterium]
MNRYSSMFHNEIEKLAYQFWEERGKPLGSSEEDWFRAERELLREFGPSFSFLSDTPIALPFASFTMEPITQ